jgi:hypothetical protein
MELAPNQPTSRIHETDLDALSNGAGVPRGVALPAGAAASRPSPDERRRREDAVRFANASIGLEGLVVSAAEHAHADRFVAGEIDLAEFLDSPVKRPEVRATAPDATSSACDGSPEVGV